MLEGDVATPLKRGDGIKWKFISGEKSWGDMKRRGLGSKAGTA